MSREISRGLDDFTVKRIMHPVTVARGGLVGCADVRVRNFNELPGSLGGSVVLSIADTALRAGQLVPCAMPGCGRLFEVKDNHGVLPVITPVEGTYCANALNPDEATQQS